MEPNFDSMNETDVREIIVRPLLTRLGFKHGTEANIRTEVRLTYDKAFLGRKNPGKDPPLVGRADYICEVVSYGRWTVEVKAPGEILSQDDVEQAHTYSAHPQVAASHFMLTNGREFRLYATGHLEQPLLTWTYEQTDAHILSLWNVIGPAAIKKRRERDRPDPGKPLGFGVPSRLRIVGGEVTYGSHESSHPLFQVDVMNGLVGAITGGTVDRAQDGRLLATVGIRSPHQYLSELNRLAGLENFEFFSADEYISNDLAIPTIFQNVLNGRIEPGHQVRMSPAMPIITLPIGFDFTVFTEAVGYLDNDSFVGNLSFDYRYRIIRGRPSGIPQLDQMIANSPVEADLKGTGSFRIIVVPAT